MRLKLSAVPTVVGLEMVLWNLLKQMLCLPDAAASFLSLYLCFLVVFGVFQTATTFGDGGLALPNQFEIDECISRIDIGQKAFGRISAHRIYFKSNGLTSHEMAEKVP